MLILNYKISFKNNIQESYVTEIKDFFNVIFTLKFY